MTGHIPAEEAAEMFWCIDDMPLASNEIKEIKVDDMQKLKDQHVAQKQDHKIEAIIDLCRVNAELKVRIAKLESALKVASNILDDGAWFADTDDHVRWTDAKKALEG